MTGRFSGKIAEIKNQQQIDAQLAEKEIQRIEDEISSNRRKSAADAEFYSAQKMAEGNALKFTPQYLELMK